MLRTFVATAGTHAIAVGFPQKSHFAFDAQTCRLAELWKGKFLNAHGTWFDRFTPPAVPLGKNQVVLPARGFVSAAQETPAALPSNGQDPKRPNVEFRGYRLDRQGVPTFLYALNGLQVEDRIAPDGKRALRRRLTITQPKTGSATFWLAVANDPRAPDDQGVFATKSRIHVALQPATGVIRSRGKQSELLAPLRTHLGRLEVIYRW